MKLTLFAIGLGLAGLISAQTSMAGLPDCAKTCVSASMSGSTIGGCSSIDIKCICQSSGYLDSIACCLAGACNAQDQATAVSFAQGLCKSSGVTDLPSAVVCSSSASAISTSTSAASSSTSSTTTESHTSSTSASATAAAKPNDGVQKAVGIGAQFVGGLAAMVLL